MSKDCAKRYFSQTNSSVTKKLGAIGKILKYESDRCVSKISFLFPWKTPFIKFVSQVFLKYEQQCVRSQPSQNRILSTKHATQTSNTFICVHF